ncbi:5-oxoprolinase subunit C family protein [Angustibacter luteus]|uniref:Biotin-dependent carboxyltransferase family protein n=1 Tax=Angustibacter luteus TaxID=658456 RepID=A0ABW1JFI0_9ACTN
MTTFEVLATGPLATVQDAGRAGLAHLGVGPSGAADRTSLGQVNRLLGNAEGAAAVEVTLGGLHLRANGSADVAVVGAPAQVHLGRRAIGSGTPFRVEAGDELTLAAPSRGLRSYLGVRGGITTDPVLGSRSSDLLAGVGPGPLRPGDVLPVGADVGPWPGVDVLTWLTDPAEHRRLRAVAGPRREWFSDAALDDLAGGPWRVSGDANRTAVVLDGPAIIRSHDGELPPEGMVRGAIQVPPSGRPTILLADHPVTGGYPVLAVLLAEDVDWLAQLRPGDPVLLQPVVAPVL